MAEKKTYEELEEYVRELETALKGQGNREYKSRLFSFLFGRDENKRWTLSLYNAVHGTAYDDLSGITINTMEDVVYMGMKNDVSLLVSETVSLYRSMELYEQQSSFNPNMPIREFMYAGKLYDKFIHVGKLNRYSKRLMPLPLPKLLVFYNGEDEKEDEVVLSLSDAFKEEIRRNVLRAHGGKVLDGAGMRDEAERIYREASPDIEVRVRMVNINHGHNRELLSACRPLGEYAWFVDRVRQNNAAGKGRGDNLAGIGEAIDRAIDEMPDSFEIKKFIMANRSEVKDMCLTEYNEAETMKILREEALEEGREEGLREGHKEGREEGWQKAMLQSVQNLMDGMGWTAEKAMDLLKIPQARRADLYVSLPEKAMTE